MNEYRMALAIDLAWRERIAAAGVDKLLVEREGKESYKDVETPDNTYRIYLWDWEGFDPDDYDSLMHYLENQRHALVRISDDGTIWSDISISDSDGTDEEFEEILGWTSNICLWSETKNLLFRDPDPMSRYVLEPRGATTGGRWGTQTWLVIRDMRTGKYITDEGGRRYLKFKDSRDAIAYIMNVLATS